MADCSGAFLFVFQENIHLFFHFKNQKVFRNLYTKKYKTKAYRFSARIFDEWE